MDVLVLGPGGIKGFLELGALYYLEETDRLREIHTLVGVSVGAIICLLLNIGLTVKEILHIAIEESDFINIEELDILYIMTNFRKHSGLFSNQKIREVLSNIINDKLSFVPTLRELYEITNKELVTVTYNLSKESVIYMSYKNYPDTNCIDAILISINIPIVFHMLKMNEDVYIDGAFGDPYPILLKDNGRNRVLGIYIESKTGNKDNILIYIHDAIHCLFTNLTKRNASESSVRCKHLGLKCDVIYAIGTHVSITDKARMFLYGYSEAKSFNYSY